MDKKRRVRAIIQDLNRAKSEDLINSNALKELLIREIPEAIESALDNRSLFATIFEINDSNNFVEIHKRDWINALESCLKHHIQKENYEACSRINSMINRINEKSKLTINKSEKDGRV